MWRAYSCVDARFLTRTLTTCDRPELVAQKYPDSVRDAIEVEMYIVTFVLTLIIERLHPCVPAALP